MTDVPRISIVTPSFNQAAYLEETIESVLKQGYPNLQYVIIDGGSTDGSIDVIRKYENQLHYWESAPDNGHGHALNKGFARTDGEIMAWINSDDKYLPWAFETVAEVFAKFTSVNWISGIPALWDARGRLIGTLGSRRNAMSFLLGDYGGQKWRPDRDFIQQESVFWRRSLWEQSGGFISQDVEFAVDGELWSRFFSVSRLHYLQCILSGYRIHASNRATANMSAIHSEMDDIVRRMRKATNWIHPTDLKIFQLIRSLKRFPLTRWMPFEAVARRVFAPAYRRATIPVIACDGLDWVLYESPYTA